MQSRQRSDRHVMLVADLGCVYCHGLAGKVRELSKGKISLRDIADPYLPDEARSNGNAATEPALILSDQSRVSVYRGVGMRLRLARLIGPVASTRLLEHVVRASWQQGHSQVADESHGIGRRRLLGASGVMALAAALGVSGATAASANEPRTTDREPSPTDDDIRRVLVASDSWSGASRMAQRHGVKPHSVLKNVIKGPGGMAIVESVWTSPDHTDAAMSTTSVVDTANSSVNYMRTVEVIGKHEPRIVARDTSGPLFTLHLSELSSSAAKAHAVTPHGKVLFDGIVDEDGKLTASSGYDAVARRISSTEQLRRTQSLHAGPPQLQPMFWGIHPCDWAVDVLCASESYVLCAGLCSAAFIVISVIGSAACIIACGLLNNYSCQHVKELVC